PSGRIDPGAGARGARTGRGRDPPGPPRTGSALERPAGRGQPARAAGDRAERRAGAGERGAVRFDLPPDAIKKQPGAYSYPEGRSAAEKRAGDPGAGRAPAEDERVGRTAAAAEGAVGRGEGPAGRKGSRLHRRRRAVKGNRGGAEDER